MVTTSNSVLWREQLEAAGFLVGTFQYPEFRKPGQYIVIPALATLMLPERYHDLPVQLISEHLFRTTKPTSVMGFCHKPFQGRQRLDCRVVCLKTGDPATVEMTPEWLRFYLKVSKDCGHSKEELEGQEPIGLAVIHRIAEQVKRTISVK